MKSLLIKPKDDRTTGKPAKTEEAEESDCVK